MPIQDNTNDCGVFMLIFIYHLLLMEGINNFDQLDDEISKPDRNKLIYCDASNMHNLREFVLKTILRKCTVTPQPTFETGEQYFSFFFSKWKILYLFITNSKNLKCCWNNTIFSDSIDCLSNL